MSTTTPSPAPSAPGSAATTTPSAPPAPTQPPSPPPAPTFEESARAALNGQSPLDRVPLVWKGETHSVWVDLDGELHAENHGSL